MDEDDTHFCMKCKSEIQGLEKYIKHRKDGCPASAKASPVKTTKGKPSEGSETDAAAVTEPESGTVSEENASVAEPAEPRRSGRPKRTPRVPKAKTVYVDPDDLLEDSEVNDTEVDVPEVKDTEANETEVKVESKTTKPTGRPRGRPKGSKNKSPSDLPRRSRKLYKQRKRELLECDLCNFMTSTDKRLLAHTKSPMHEEKVAREQGGDRIFKCMFCEETFCLDRALRAHNKIHSAKPYCQECSLFFSTKTSLAKHLADSGHKTKYSCDICAKEFPMEAHLKVHMTVHMTDKPFECTECSFKTKRRADLNIHMKRHMGIKPFKCSLCPFKSVKRSVLTRHMETHKDRPRDLICEICGAAYCSKMVLQHHIFTQHQNGRRYPCDFEGCTYMFCYKSELTAHRRSHTKEKPYLCSVCGYEGSNTYALTKHTRIHTKEKPFVCPFPSCTYASRFSAHLVRHKRLHTGEKPYKCPFCNYRCNAQENLRKHVKNTKKHQGKDMYTCSKCDVYTTNNYKDLVHHTRSKHGKEYVKLQDVSRDCGIYQPGATGVDNNNIVERALAESMVDGLPEASSTNQAGPSAGGGKMISTQEGQIPGGSGKEDAEPELVIDTRQGQDIIEHALAEAAGKQLGGQQAGYQLQATPNGNTDYLVIGQVYGGGHPAPPQNIQLPQQIEISTTGGVTTATQGVAEAMRCLAQGFGDQNQQVSFVVTNVVQKDATPMAVIPAPQQQQQHNVAIHAAHPPNNSSNQQYSFYGTKPASTENGPTPVQIFTSSTVQPQQGFGTATTGSNMENNKAAPSTAAAYHQPGNAQSMPSTSRQPMPHPGEQGDGGNLPFSQSLVQVVQRVRETTDEDTAVTILQEMDANADRILKQN